MQVFIVLTKNSEVFRSSCIRWCNVNFAGFDSKNLLKIELRSASNN